MTACALEQCHFLVSAQESNQRKRHRGGADQLASSRARAALPCVPLPAALTMALEHLNVESMPLCKEKNC